MGRFKKRKKEKEEGSAYWSLGGEILVRSSGGKGTKELEKRAIATKAAQVCFSSFLESLSILAFSVHLFLNI